MPRSDRIGIPGEEDQQGCDEAEEKPTPTSQHMSAQDNLKPQTPDEDEHQDAYITEPLHLAILPHVGGLRLTVSLPGKCNWMRLLG